MVSFWCKHKVIRSDALASIEAFDVQLVPTVRTEIMDTVSLPAEEVVEGTPALASDTIRAMQEQHPNMTALKEYIINQKLPSDRMARIRVLEASPLYDVNQAGLLCRVRERGIKGSLGMYLQVMVQEALRGAIIQGCHQGDAGHYSVMKTYQKVRDRFYWPGMFSDIQQYCGTNIYSKARAAWHA